MKFPNKNSPKNNNSKGGSAQIQKGQKKAHSKPVNPTIPFNGNKNAKKSHPASGPSNKGPQRNSRLQEQNHDQNPEQRFDQQQANMDAHINIGNHKNKSKGKNFENAQYDELLDASTKGFKRQKNLYFLENKKYQGKAKQQQSEEDDEIDEEGIDENEDGDFEDEMMDSEQEQNYGDDDEQEDGDQPQDQESQQNNQIHKALSLLKQKRHSTSKLINTQLSSINAQDEANIKTTMKNKSKTTQSQHQQAMQLKTVLEIYDKLVGLRYGQQNELQEIKRYPVMDEALDVPKYPPMSHELYTASRELETEMVSNLSQYFSVFKQLAKKTVCSGKVSSNLHNDSEDDAEEIKDQQQEDNEETAEVINLAELVQADNPDNKDQDSLNSGRLNVDQLYSFIKTNISAQVSKVQTELVKWSQKTSFLTPSSPSQLKSLLMQTPVGQAKKVMQNWQRMASKCQQKRGREMFKILFEPEDNIHELSHPEIYDDYDLFIQLEKYYLERLQDDNEDGQFLQSATMKYLKNKQAKQLEHEKKQQQVDRKASKNRKIRYNVHTKLLNFVPAVPENVMETRDQIVRNIFNCNAKINEQSMEGNVSKYRAAQHHDDTELIEVE